MKTHCSVEIVHPRHIDQQLTEHGSDIQISSIFQGEAAMPDFISRKRLKKKVIDRWENEGGTALANQTKSTPVHPPPKRKRKNMRGQLSQDRVADGK